MKANKKPLILLTNDDGLHAGGMQASIEIAREFGDVVVVTSFESMSGMSHAITIKTPLRIKKIKEEEGLTIYMANGTPVDCIKLAVNSLFEELPDLVISGINHGANTSISVIYSGTMGGAMEASFYGIPSIGFSIDSFSPKADFSAMKRYMRSIISNTLEKGLPDGICLNVNAPAVPVEDIKGVKVCRQTKGVWREEFDKRKDPHGAEYYWLTGYFENQEPEADDTDDWAVKNNYVAIVPVQIDMTAYSAMSFLKKMEL